MANYGSLTAGYLHAHWPPGRFMQQSPLFSLFNLNSSVWLTPQSRLPNTQNMRCSGTNKAFLFQAAKTFINHFIFGACTSISSCNNGLVACPSTKRHQVKAD